MSTTHFPPKSYMMPSPTTILYVLFFWEVITAFKRKYTRRSTFKKALERSKITNKKLLVIGDPNNGFFNKLTGPDYTFGDVCIDLTGCPSANKELVVVHKGAVEDILPSLNLRDYVIFQSCVFEYVERYDIVKRHLENVNSDDLFMVHVEPWSLAAYIYPGFLLGDNSVPKRVFWKYPPFNSYVATFRNPLASHNKKCILLFIMSFIYFYNKNM